MVENTLKRIDANRRILIPQEIRDKVRIKENSEVNIEVENNIIIISLVENDSEDGSDVSDNA